MKKIQSALISVFKKDKIENICSLLSENNIKIYSTGGTYDYISRLGIKLEKVEDLTSYPSILKGRVKTLHPKIFGGILKTNSSSDIEDSKNLTRYIFGVRILIIILALVGLILWLFL